MGKKQKCPEFENHERWLVSFADMMTLLFAVFVVLYALKDSGAKDSDVEQAAASIQEAFNEVMEDIPPDRRVGPTEAGLGIFENLKANQEEMDQTNKFTGGSDYSNIIGKEIKKVSELIDMRLYGNQRFRSLEASGQSRIITVHRDRDGFRVRLLASHFFNPGSYKIKNKLALEELAEVAKIMKEINRPVTIEGHTDNVPFEGEGSNWDLSSLRATNVLKFFIRKTDFDPAMISAAGYGDTRPVSSNATSESRTLNRRIEIKVHYE